MKTLKGLYSDSSLQDVPSGSYVFAKNIVDGNIIGTKENEDGFIQAGLLAPYTVIGVAPIGKDFIVFSTDNTNSEIGLVSRSGVMLTYTAKYNDPALNFNTNYPILKTEYRIDVNNQRTVAWTDAFNTPRLINIDDTASITNIQELNIFQDINNPSIQSSTINDTGGSLKTGAFIIITKYKNSENNAETNWFIHDHVFYINLNSKALNFELDDGSEGGLISNKSISILFNGCDTRYDILETGYIQVINGTASAYQTSSITNGATVNFTLTGNETVTAISLDSVLVSTTSYNTATTLTQLAGRLFLGNLTASPLPALQQIALDININWASNLVQVVPATTNNHKDNIPPTLIPGEVYAFYLGVELNTGGWRLYHIPGRASISSAETQTVTNEGMTYRRFQIENTAYTSSGLYHCGYWENESESYPNTADYNNGSIDLRNQAVRHHKMPSLTYLAQTVYPSVSNFGVDQLPVLTITATNVNIPSNIQSQIKRWKVFYAKKDQTNSIFLGSDVLQHPGIPEGSPSLRWGTAGNWSVDAYYSGGGSDRWADFTDIDKTIMRGHSIDYLYNKSLPAPTYAIFPYKLIRGNLVSRYAGFRSLGATLTYTGSYPNPISSPNNSGGSVASGVIDYTVSSQTSIDRTTNGFKRLDNFFYLPQNAQNGVHKSEYNEGAFIATIHNANSSWINRIMVITRGTNEAITFVFNTVPVGGLPQEETMYMHYCRYITSVHSPFSNQITIPLEGYANPSNTSQTFSGGNGFLNYFSFLSTAPICSNPDSGVVGKPNLEGIRMWRAYIGYSTHNFNYRYQVPGDQSTYYYGKTDVRTLFSPIITPSGLVPGQAYTSLIDTNSSLNVINYDTDYNQLNEFNTNVIFSPSLVEETIFPNTIIFSPVQSEESKATSWRTFLSGDRYVLPKNKGQIINLQGLNNRQLLLHTEFSLFRTRTDIQVATQQSTENVFFQTASLFSLPPEEVLPVTSGYAGTQNKQSCILTKAGYFFVDSNQGKAFLYDSLLNEISSNGLRNFFRDFTHLDPNPDNAFTSSGITAAYDERNNRLLVSKKDSGLSWTLSYNPFQKTWVSYHDYIPDHMFNTVDNILYSIKDNQFYIHNVLNSITEKGVYYNNIVNSSYVDIPFNSDQRDKLFTGINWVTELYPNSYTTGQPDTTLNYGSTFTHITLRSLDHCSGRIQLIPNNEFTSLYNSNVRNINRTWYFNDIRDIVSAPGFTLPFYQNYNIDPTKLDTNPVWYNQRRFIDKFLICRLEYDNTQNNRCLLLDSNVESTYVSK